MLDRRSAGALVALALAMVAAAPAAAQSGPAPVNVQLDGFGQMSPDQCPAGDAPVTNSYSVTGTSTGNHPGTFTATGDVYWDPDANTLELRNAGFTIDSPAGRIEATLVSYWPTEEDEFSIFCSETSENAFQSGFMAGWRGTLTAPDGTLWSVYGDVSPDITRWGDNLWRYTQSTRSEPPVRLQPAGHADCKDGRYRSYGFANQGACVAFVESSRGR